MLQKRYSREMEEKWQKWWAENNIYSFDEDNSTRPIYSIDTPPPFTSGELHMGHVLSYSYFDFAARYKRMRGFNVYYPQGWDTQGFPTEVRVEKKHGRLPPAEFRKKCVEWSEEMIKRMKGQMNSLGFSADWKHEYRTMDSDYHKKVQLSLIKMYDKKLVYREKYPVFWCPKCVSAVAKAELDDVQKETGFYYLKFSAEGKDITIATTRPELLPACAAVLYHPDDERYNWLDEKKVITPLGKEIRAIADKDVDREFGTGAVMVCTFGDKMDVIWTLRYKLPVVDVIDERGKMINSGEFDGLKTKEARKRIIERLASEGRVVKEEKIGHTVKAHDRCKSHVELLSSFQWFADIKSTGNHVKALAEKITWIPKFGITYLTDWVDGAEWDWVISRQRIFGTPLPFYTCEKCGHTATAEESELPFYPEKAGKKKCECGAEMKAETSTCDCWVDSSITPLVIAGWPDDEKRMEKLYPSSLRPQGVEIVRTWAFYTIYRSGFALTNMPPFRTVLLNGNVLAPDGKKMSKSLGNIISPTELLRDYSADAVRQWAAMSGAMAKDRPFSYEDIKFAKNFLTKLWNAAKFVESVTKDWKEEEAELSMVDRWILSKLSILVKNYTDAMEKYEYHTAARSLHDFFWHDFCDNYIEFVKHRVYGEDKNSKDAACKTLRKVLLTSIKLLAPITAHISEEIYHEMFGQKESIHLSPWPEDGEVDADAMKQADKLAEIVKSIRQQKAKMRLAQNAEVEKVVLTLDVPLPEELENELKAVCKVKEIENIEGEFAVSVI